MTEANSRLKVILTDSWDDDIWLAVGQIAVAFAQLDHILWISPKRIKEIPIKSWEKMTKQMTIPKRTKEIKDSYKAKIPTPTLEKQRHLEKILQKVCNAADKRNAIMHARWGCQKSDGKITERFRIWKGKNLGVDISSLNKLRDEIRKLRDELGRYEW
jgi:hypothetical protein